MVKKDLIRLRNIGLTFNEISMVYLTDEPKIPTFTCYPNKLAKKKYFVGNTYGVGSDSKEILARIKAIAECLERMSVYNLKSTFKISIYKKEKNYVDPASFLCYSKEQINQELYNQKAREGKYKWIIAEDLINQRKVFLPAQIVYLGKGFEKEFPLRRERITTGVAFGKEKVVESGFLEIIERDTFISSYLSRKTIKEIINLPKKYKKIIDYLKRYQLEVKLFDLKNDFGIPVIMSIVIDRTGLGPAVKIGACARFSYWKTIEHSILEPLQMRRQGRIISEINNDKIPKENEIFNGKDRHLFWSKSERIKDIDFWWKKSEKIKYKQLRSKTTNFVQAIKLMKKLKVNIYLVDITLDEVKKFGFTTKKVIIPELQPLYQDENAKSLYSKYRGEIKDNKQLKPHPFT